MRRHFLIIILFVMLIIIPGRAQSQISILLVDDDNYSSPDHIGRIENAITDAGYSYTLFNAQDSAASPSKDVMDDYDLVFWYSANDGVGGYFWDGTDSDNQALIDYLDGGGMLWAMGNDIIYDRYGGAPDDFTSGDFLYDYMGLDSYDCQSKVDDNGDGVPMLIRVPGQNIATSLDTIRWYFSSGGLWYADGCTPRSEADSVYAFGPDTYELAGKKTSIFYSNGVYNNFGCYWDAYYMDSDSNRAKFFKDVLDYFNGIKYPNALDFSSSGFPVYFKVGQNYPNPFNPSTSIRFSIQHGGTVHLAVFDVLGRQYLDKQITYAAPGEKQFILNGSSWPSGLYFYRVTFLGHSIVKKMLLTK